MDRPIPAFYACYLLRSTVRHQNLYVGSTPNPVRRLRQHNGIAKGGAVRTSRDSLRPWEMTCLVTGFPSKIAALQFEWAWQNTHLTRHIAADDRITQAQVRTRFSPKTGRARKRIARPRYSLTDKLANLHLLLRASSFERWPLKVTFYAEDVFKAWLKWTDKHPAKLREALHVGMDESMRASLAAGTSVEAAQTETPKGIYALDVGYTGLKTQLTKSQALLEGLSSGPCAVCQDSISSGTAALSCPDHHCEMVAHLTCLSNSFLRAEGNHDALVPIGGQCPCCTKQLHWVDLVKELSLRIRGAKEVTALFKERKSRTKREIVAVDDEDVVMDEFDDEDEEADEEGFKLPRADEDGWNYLDDVIDDRQTEIQIRSDPSPPSRAKHGKKWQPATSYSEPVIEDSDWDDAETLT